MSKQEFQELVNDYGAQVLSTAMRILGNRPIRMGPGAVRRYIHPRNSRRFYDGIKQRELINFGNAI